MRKSAKPPQKRDRHVGPLGLLAMTGFLCLSAPFLSLLADDSEISVKAEVDRAFITIGDPVQYTVTIRYAPSVQLLSEIPLPNKELFKIKKIEEFKSEEKGMKVRGKRFTLTTFRLGEFILDPVQIQYRIGDSTPQMIETNRIYLTVKSVAAQDDPKTDIRDIKSVLSLPMKWLGLILLILAFILLPFLWLGYRVWRKPAAAFKEPETILSPEEEALFRLNQLFESDLLRRGKVKDYYLLFSEILRSYFEKRFKILAVEFTTYEILRSLKPLELSSSLYEKIAEVLEAADLAKFAKWKPEPAQVIQLNQKAKQIIDEARPKPEGVGGGV